MIWFKCLSHDQWRRHTRGGEESYQRLLEQKRKFESRILTDTDCIFGALVYLNDDGQKTDSVASAWKRLLKKVSSVSQYSFKHLRKTGADMIKRISGSEEVAQTYLSHKPTSVSGKHYTNRDYDRLADALREMRSQLEPMFSKT